MTAAPTDTEGTTTVPNDLPIRLGPYDNARELYATGFNAWGQLVISDPDRPPREDDEYREVEREPRGKVYEDLFTFLKVLAGHEMSRPESYTSFTKVKMGDSCSLAGSEPAMVENLEFGDLNCVTARTANGSLLVYDPAAFQSLSRFPSIKDWRFLRDESTWRVRSQPKELSAFDTGFVVLYEDGSVDTLGDSRFEECLGRDVTPTSPAEEPGRVTDLDNLDGPIIRVSAGGYCVAAVTKGGSLYVWGCRSPGASGPFPDISRVPNYMEVDGDKDVVDVAVGDSHALALTSDGTVYTIGGNANGQLGIGRDISKVYESWTKSTFKARPGYKVLRVDAGPRASFITTARIV